MATTPAMPRRPGSAACAQCDRPAIAEAEHQALCVDHYWRYEQALQLQQLNRALVGFSLEDLATLRSVIDSARRPDSGPDSPAAAQGAPRRTRGPRDGEAASGTGRTPDGPQRSMLTVKEAAAILAVNPMTIYDAIYRDHVPGVVRIGRAIRIKRAEFESWVDRLGQGLPPRR